MNVQTALRQIDEANAKHFSVGEEYDRVRDDYERVLEEVDRIAGGTAVEKVLKQVSEHIRNHESRPSEAIVADYAVAACREVGTEVPDESWLPAE